MSFQSEQKRKFDELQSSISSTNRSQMRAQSNGGNTILFSYAPGEEHLYLQQAKAQFPNAAFVDISQLLIEYIDETGWADFEEFYKAYSTSTHQVFKSESEQADFFDSIISAISDAYQAEKIPFLIRTGILYGTGIENVNIMEHSLVMNNSVPLVVFYPSLVDKDNLYFLNFKPASKYRCNLIG